MPPAARRPAPAAILRLRSQAGLTLVETMVGMVILLVGLLSTFTLVDVANGSQSRSKAREGATNLARELLEEARDTPYDEIGSANWFHATLQDLPGRSSPVTGNGWEPGTTVNRGGTSYEVSVRACSLDDSRDGHGTHSPSKRWCTDSTATGSSDSLPEDMKRVTVELSYSVGGKAQPRLTQTALFSSSGTVVGPEVTGLQIIDPTGLTGSPPTVTSSSTTTVTFRATSVGAADMKFTVEGVEQTSGVTGNGNGTWDFAWPISSLKDATYTIGAVAVDALGTRGAPRTMQVKLARGAPVAPANVTGGYNYVNPPGEPPPTGTQVVELEWDANPEGSVTGYSAEKGGSTVPGCGQSLSTSCIDQSPASSGDTTYTVKTHYTDGAGAAQSVSTNYTVTAPGAGGSIAFVKNVGQASCGTTSMTITVPAGGVTAGNTLIVRLMLRGNSAGAVGASDSRGNAYTADKDVMNVDQRIVVFSAAVETALSGGDTITVTHPDANSKGVAADEFSGVAAAGRVDATGSATGNSTTPAVSVTTANADDLAIGAVSIANLQTGTQPAAWTGLTSQVLSCGNPSSAKSSSFGAYRIASTGGTYTYNPTMSNGGRWAAAAVGYKAASGSPLDEPEPPTGLTVTANGDGTRTLTWSAPSSSTPAVEFYRIYRDGYAIADRVDTLSSLSWTDTNSGGTSHSYRVTSAASTLTESDVLGPVTG
jgi:Tfp pilus assembly protein PilV